MTSDQKVAVITGCSSGIGCHTSLALAVHGFISCATMRNTEKIDDILRFVKEKNLSVKVLEMNVDSDESVESTINQIIRTEKRIDLLVNNAGYSLLGAAEDLTSEEIYSIFDTNVFGIYRTIRNIVPIMRTQGSGMIINISSLNSILPTPFCSAYVATKAALDGLSQSLRYELMNFGIKVTSINPGAIRTNITQHGVHLPIKIQGDRHSIYEKVTNDVLRLTKEAVSSGIDPRQVADLIIQIANTRQPEVRYFVGRDAQRLSHARKKINDEEYDKFMINKI